MQGKGINKTAILIFFVVLIFLAQASAVQASKKTGVAKKPSDKFFKTSKPKSNQKTNEETAKKKKAKGNNNSLKTEKPKSTVEKRAKNINPYKPQYSQLKRSRAKITPRSTKDQDIVELRLNEEAERLVGIPYCAGGASLRGTDCSGLTRQIYSRLFGINMPHNSTDQSRLPFLTDVPVDDLQAGDLIFWGPNKKRINHVGIYLADGKFIHASRKSGVTISSFYEPYWVGRFIGSKRVKGLAAYTDGIRTASRTDDTTYDVRQAVALGYNTPMLGSNMDLNLGAFMEFNRSEKTATWRYAGLNPSYGSYDMGFRKGAWVSTDAKIFDWLAITPTLGYVDGHSAAYDKDGVRQILGLGARMAPNNSRWSLVMSAAYSTQPDESLQWSELSHRDWKTLDMSFGFSYSFTNLLKLSVTGTRTGKDLLDGQEDLNKGLKLDDVLFRFDVGF